MQTANREIGDMRPWTPEDEKESRRAWSPEEDQIIIDCMKGVSKRKEGIDKAVELLPGRTRGSIDARFRMKLQKAYEEEHGEFTAKKFTPEEDRLILETMDDAKAKDLDLAAVFMALSDQLERNLSSVKARYTSLVVPQTGTPTIPTEITATLNRLKGIAKERTKFKEAYETMKEERDSWKKQYQELRKEYDKLLAAVEAFREILD